MVRRSQGFERGPESRFEQRRGGGNSDGDRLCVASKLSVLVVGVEVREARGITRGGWKRARDALEAASGLADRAFTLFTFSVD
jgi:hypothetical protein